MSGLFPFFCATMKAQREREAQNMSMEDWDFGYYGKGLDGYVHFRQGIKEIESHAPYSKCRHGRDDSLDDLDDLDEYDDPEDDLFYEPPQKTPVSSAKPVMPSESTTKEADSNTQTVQTSSPEAEPQQETPTKRSIWDSKWWKNKWDYGFAVSAAVSFFFVAVEEIFQTEAGETVATATGAVFLVFLVIEVVRLVMWILNPPPPPGF